MKIEFRLLDKTTGTFKVVYFQEWNKRQPLFTCDPERAQKYWHKKLANEDIDLLKKAQSRTSVTLSINLVP